MAEQNMVAGLGGVGAEGFSGLADGQDRADLMSQ